MLTERWCTPVSFLQVVPTQTLLPILLTYISRSFPLVGFQDYHISGHHKQGSRFTLRPAST